MTEEMLDVMFNSIGTFGVVLILLAYFLIQTEKISSKGLKYSVINLFGAIFILISLLKNWNLPSFIIEVCWISISLYGIYQCIRKKHYDKKTNR